MPIIDIFSPIVTGVSSAEGAKTHLCHGFKYLLLPLS